MRSSQNNLLYIGLLNSKWFLFGLRKKNLLLGLNINHSKITTSSAVFNKNYYDILQVSSNANQSEIKNAYYKLSMIYHPDQSKNDVLAVEEFKNIAEAYEILGDIHKRRRYDKGRKLSSGFVDSSINPVSRTKQKANWQERDKSIYYGATNRSHYFDELTNMNKKQAFARKQQYLRNFKDYKVHLEHDVEGSNFIGVFSVGVFISSILVYFYMVSHKKSEKVKTGEL